MSARFGFDSHKALEGRPAGAYQTTAQTAGLRNTRSDFTDS